MYVKTLTFIAICFIKCMLKENLNNLKDAYMYMKKS